MNESKASRRCCFAGHNKLYTAEVKAVLTKEIVRLIKNNNVTEFWVGKYGRFEMMCAMTISELKKVYPELKLNIIVPYEAPNNERGDRLYYCDYDSIYSADVSKNLPPRRAAMKADQYMIDRSDFLICYVENETGGAVKALKYAQKSGDISIVNIAKMVDNI